MFQHNSTDTPIVSTNADTLQANLRWLNLKVKKTSLYPLILFLFLFIFAKEEFMKY